jgi:hypothetical protein
LRKYRLRSSCLRGRSKDVFVTFVLAIGAALVGTVFVVWIGSGGAIPISNAIVRVPSFFFAGLWIPQVLSAVATVWFIQAFFGRLWLLVYAGYFSNFGNAEFIWSHGCASDVHTSTCGLNQLGSSKLAVLIATM